MFKQETNVQTFNSAQFGALRTQTVENGQILFCLNDVMKSLDLSHITKLKSRLNERGCTTSSVPTYNQYGAEVVQEMIFIDEPNLYRCIFQSRKKEAEQFQTWVFEEVLPSIRQNGGYLATTQSDTPELIMARALQVAQATIENHKQQLQITTAERDRYQEEVKACPKGTIHYIYANIKKTKKSHRNLRDKKRCSMFVASNNTWAGSPHFDGLFLCLYIFLGNNILQRCTLFGSSNAPKINPTDCLTAGSTALLFLS